MKNILFIVIGVLFFSFNIAWVSQGVAQQERKTIVDYVDPMMGTSTSRWMLYPGPSMPFGMVKLSPDNQEEGWKAGYEYDIDNIAGFSHLHSWTMGALLNMPITGELQIQPGPENNPDAGYRSRFSHENESASPGYYSVLLDDYDIKAELTTTTRVGFQRYTFPEAENAYILFDLLFPTEYGFHVLDAQITKVNDSEIEGYVKQRSTSYNEFTVHFVAQVNKPMQSFGGWVDDNIQYDTDKIEGKGDVGGFFKFSTDADEEIVLRTGISLVSIEQARLNLETEVEPFGWNFDQVKEENRQVWNDLLSKIEVEGGTETDKVKFYTNLYRSYTARTIWSDVNGKYVDMCEEVQQLEDPDSPVYGADAFWNTFWNLNQLWTLVNPDLSNKWVKSFMEIYDKGGWLPKGPTGIEYSDIMVASHEIPLMVSAYQKGIRNYDVDKMYEAIKHNQTEQGRPHPCGGYVGNESLKDYMDFGYVPTESRSEWGNIGQVSNTLEYGYDDWTVGQMAKALGKQDDYNHFKDRAAYYKNVFDSASGYVRPKNADGSWRQDFDAFSGEGYVEGNAWQFTWFVPQDVQGLIDLMGVSEFNTRLERGFEESDKLKFSAELIDPENEYEAMTKLPVNHGNQPNMQAAYLFNYSGKPWQTQKWARRIMEVYYGEGPHDGWLGDEDQGQMGAWYVMSAMGLFEMRGGASVKPVYEIGSPVFDKITIHLNSNYYPAEKFVIEARNNSKENVYIQSAQLDGEPLEKPWFYHSELVDGGKLILEMGPKPNKKWGSDPEEAPPSMSNSEE